MIVLHNMSCIRRWKVSYFLLLGINHATTSGKLYKQLDNDRLMISCLETFNLRLLY